ncbi:conserved hypothetical protein, membrane [mine drainage metagenome]|uniref:Uncharacterized protein n=1 Tax=mine drainage metagenome TaxID=410659 RepID=T1AB84_9ZZZZ
MKINKRDLEVASASVIGTAAYVHYLQLFILRSTAPTLIAGVVFGTIYLAISIGLAKSIRIFYLLGIISPLQAQYSPWSGCIFMGLRCFRS